MKTLALQSFIAAYWSHYALDLYPIKSNLDGNTVIASCL